MRIFDATARVRFSYYTSFEKVVYGLPAGRKGSQRDPGGPFSRFGNPLANSRFSMNFQIVNENDEIKSSMIVFERDFLKNHVFLFINNPYHS